MKTCARCQIEQPETEYAKKRGGLQPYCKTCNKAYQRQHYLQNKASYVAAAKAGKPALIAQVRAWLTSYLSTHPCVDCGESDPDVLDFDHVRGEKLFNLGAAAWAQRSVASLEVEAAKCEIRCANCHRRKTRRTQGWYSHNIACTAATAS